MLCRVFWGGSSRGLGHHHVGPGRHRLASYVGLAFLVASAVTSTLVLTSAPVTQAAVVASRYHTGIGDPFYMNQGYDAGRSSQVLLPPIAWLFQDYEATHAACPVLVGVCIAGAVGFLLQHCFGRCFPFFRIAVFYPPTLKAGEFWRLFTHAALHSDIGHLFVNLLHILNTMDLEGTLRGSGYPASYMLGSYHTAGVAAVATAFGALVGSVPCFGAMFEGASALCFGLDGALFGACALLLGAAPDPSLQGFLKVRGLYTAIHMGMDLLRGCSTPQGTVGTVSHLAGFVGGFCYVIIAMPLLGGRSIPTIRCTWQGWMYQECFAFFTLEHSAPVETVQFAAKLVLATGTGVALVNAFVWNRGVHASADGYALLVKPPRQQPHQPAGRVSRAG